MVETSGFGGAFGRGPGAGASGPERTPHYDYGVSAEEMPPNGNGPAASCRESTRTEPKFDALGTTG
jgi:hypothetical protein